MVALDFTIVGLTNITLDSTKRINCVTTDGSKLYVGLDNLYGNGDIYRYSNDTWENISDNEFSSIGSIHFHQGSLYVGTLGSYGSFSSADVLVNTGGGWVDTNLSATFNYNASVRSLITHNNELYAAGSYAYIWKYNNTNWSNFHFGDASSTHWTDIISDGGSNLYGFATTVTYLNNSGVLRHNGSNWSAISTPGFGDAENLLVRKFAYGGGNLYAGTYNTKTGAEIWRFSGSTWTQINTDGFGSKYNYSINDLFYNEDGVLVACTENATGGQVWAYDGSWVQQTITSDVAYQSYFYRKVQSQHILIGKARKYVSLGASSLVYNLSTTRGKGLSYWPDSNIGAIPIGNDEFRFFAANAGIQAITEGTFSDPAARRISGYYSGTFGTPFSTYSATLQGSSIRDWKSDYYSRPIGYNAAGGIYHDDTSSITLLFTHTEEYFDATATVPFIGGLRQAVSFNKGEYFFDCGQVIADYYETCAPGGGLGSLISVATPIVSGGYMYLYYGGDKSTSADTGKQLSVARASLSDVLTAANNKATTPWLKYYNGGFTQNGLSGQSSDLINTYLSRTSASFYEALKSEVNEKIFVFSPVQFDVVDQNLYALKVGETQAISVQYSDDGLKFSYPEKIIPNIFSGTYLGVVSPESYNRVLSENFTLYLVQDPELSGTKWLSGVELIKYTGQTLGLGSTDNIADGIYRPPFKINYAFDFGQLHPFIATIHYAGVQKDILTASAYYYQNASAFDSSSNWMNVVQSYANQNGLFPSSMDNYFNFQFGREFHQFYWDYCHNFNRHRVSPSITEYDGPIVLSHALGSLLYNCDFTKQPNINLITSSLDNMVRIDQSVTSGKFTSSGILNYGTSTLEYRNSGVLSHIEFAIASGTPNTYFNVIDLTTGNKSGSRKSPLVSDNVLIRQNSFDGFSRIIFNISKYGLDSTYYDVPYNFLTPNHEFEFSIKSLISDSKGLTLGGGTVGVWIHTELDPLGRVWSYVKDEWVAHDASGITKESIIKYSNLYSFRQSDRDISNTNKFKCLKFLDPNNTNRGNDVLASLSTDDFNNINVKFHTSNKKTYYFMSDSNHLHRLNQRYVIELFTIPTQDDKFTLFYDMDMIDLTLNKMSKPFVTKVDCKEFRVDLDKNRLLTILKYFNQINGAYSATGYASRVKGITQSFYEAEGGSRINYVESPLWNTNTRNSLGLIEDITIIN